MPLIGRHYAWGRDVLRGIGKYQRERRNWIIFAEPRLFTSAATLANVDTMDGFILESGDSAFIKALLKRRIPFVNLNPAMHKKGIVAPCVPNDEAAIGALGAEHLLGLGLTSLGFCGVTAENATSKRGESFMRHVRKQASRCAAIECRYDYQPLDFRRRRRDVLVAWLKALPKPCGVMAYNDLIARHVAEACVMADLQVPQDVAILGVDNDDLVCELAFPPLSSIDVGAIQQGYVAARLLDEWMCGKPPGGILHPIPPARVVQRQSTDSIAIGDPIVVHAMTFIRTHFSQHVSVDDMAADADVSRRNLEYRFKDALNSSPLREIQRARIRHARELLAGTSLAVAAIAEACGFTTAAYFSEAFLRETGHSPAVFRSDAFKKSVS